MINIVEPQKCCGCSACIYICPKHSISFQEDRDGFIYPKVDLETCIDCGLCEKVCPMINQESECLPLATYAAKNDNETVRLRSSSGGIFTLLAESVIGEGGVVFGARFNEDWEVVHDYTDTIEGLEPFRGSKYVQSCMGESYRQVENFLKADRKVMFTGTPCQIEGLRKFLRKDYNTLLTVEVVCHGAPAPLVWRTYLNNEIAKCGKDLSGVEGINFRDKLTGWKTYSLSVKLSKNIVSSSLSKDNDYMRAFLSNLSLRKSCYNCPAKSGKSGADITIGDFWGIENVRPEIDDDKGLSLVLVNSPKGMASLKTLSCEFVPVGFDEAVKGNSAYYHSVSKPVNREFFFHCIRKGHNVQDALAACESANVFHRVRRIIFRKLGL